MGKQKRSKKASAAEENRKTFKLPPEAPQNFTAGDLDEIYNNDNQDDDIGEGPNVLMHILSQLTIGMDLTKVTLPTHILERRSLLELYASLFTHTHLFLSIPSFKTPLERMVALTRWYLSAYHISLKPRRPKKPYNPVLGEVFRCHFEMTPDSKETRATKKKTKSKASAASRKKTKNTRTTTAAATAAAASTGGGAAASTTPANDGPVPWARPSDLSFIAEQVSHRPPVSAFYAESASRYMTCHAHIHTKTQFRGTYATVQLVGRGKVTLHDRGEEFNCTFPTVYIRSIFTTPWMEFGDSVVLDCPKTSFSCEVKFITKSLFGSECNAIKGSIKQAENVVAKISGQWNGAVYISYADLKRGRNVEFGDKVLLFDASTEANYKMRVRPVAMQDPNESRRKWANVTYHLFNKNVGVATMYKTKLESEQRNQQQQRQSSSEDWTPREFEIVDNTWLYRNRLEKRVENMSSPPFSGFVQTK